ncbi:tetratricopeptide repeat protein [Allokutzneria sp. A3M-2-11 16]|uniref:BTAD domain-containing putative transcriptional regulator n=1 Tax=Allokutzneria sp. A3M-2-11 16 TaxID=2962043 RepID=UPI0020B8DF55|nr:BTAD domain-containing putative transcriptional regulator [Allokutzneria sp. A3M-2-11 16]MCP3805212.1 tetratricopeptide repeat protein [Allokutzneria sp. A3M-2-11 16]
MDRAARSSLGPRIRLWRTRAGFTQTEAATAAGISVAGLRDLEQGRIVRPRPATLRRLADAFGLSAAETAELVRDNGTATGISVGVLGPLVLRTGDEVIDLGSAPQRTLLGALALSPNAPVSRDALIEAVWGHRPPTNVVEILQTHISRLRRRLTPEGPQLTATATGYQLNATADQLDLLAFRGLAAEARAARERVDLADAAQACLRALALWRDAPLSDLPAFHDHAGVAEIRQDWQALVLEFAELAAELGEDERALAPLRRLAAAEPLDEAVQARLVLTLAASGRQAAALTAFDEVRRRFADELGVDPGPKLADAHQRVLHNRVSLPISASASAHRQLPPDIGDFTGRGAELRWLAQLRHSRTALPIVAIEGMAGLGKTRLAVHFAHQLVAAGRYGDIQLYVDLRAHSDQPPADPAVVLASFLSLLGVPGAQVPRDLDSRAALYRDRLHGKRALVILDNAADERQVQPLLPASPDNLVLVTSRRHLALDGANTLALDLFAPEDAAALLATIAGGHRVDAAGADQVTALCGRLPLAVALAARRLQNRPLWTLGDLADRLRTSSGRLGELSSGTRGLRAVFDLSYRALAPEAQRFFRLLGVHPGDDATAESAAALTGTDPATARRRLDELVDEHLLTMVTARRYRLHDLLREYAAEHAGEQERHAAVERVLTWYLYAADAARERLFPHFVDIELDPVARPEHLPEHASDEDAFQWLADEHATLVAAVGVALTTEGMHPLAWQLPLVLKHYFERLSNYKDWITTGRDALKAAQRIGDRQAEAMVRSLLGVAHGQLGEIDVCIEYFTDSLALRRAVGDVTGEARTLGNLGVAHTNRGDFEDATGFLKQALELSRRMGNHHLEIRTLSNLGRAQMKSGDVDDAILSLETALVPARSLGDVVGLVAVLHNLGEALLRVGRHGEARPLLVECLEVYRDKHFRLYEAEVLELLAQVHDETGEAGRAQDHWREAVAILEELGHPRLEEVRRHILG